MHKAEFKIKAITPIFMRGANQSQAEIRASSIKGLMRWWFRALAGSYFGDDITGLRKAEEFVFGSTGRRSKVTVEITEMEIKRGNYPLPMVWNKRKGIRIYREAIAPKSHFRLRLSSHDEECIKLASYSLLGLTYFGGIGFRSNRGAGSLKISDLDSDVDLLPVPKTKNELKRFVSNLISATNKILQNLFSHNSSIHRGKCDPYSSFNCFYLYLWKSESDLKKVYYKNDNLNLNEDKLNLLDVFEKKFKDKNSHSSNYGYQDFVFGLPRGPRKDRRASPLKVGVLELSRVYSIRFSVFRTEVFRPHTSANWGHIFKFLENIGAEKIYPIGGE